MYKIPNEILSNSNNQHTLENILQFCNLLSKWYISRTNVIGICKKKCNEIFKSMINQLPMTLWTANNLFIGYYKYESKMSNSDFDLDCVWVLCPRNGWYGSHIGVLLKWSPWTTYKL